MHQLKTIIAILFLTLIGFNVNAMKSPLSITWEMGENGVQPNHYSASFTIKNISSKTLNGNWEIYFNQFPRQITNADNSQIVVTEYVPNLYKITPSDKYKPLLPGESVKVDYVAKGIFTSYCYGPDGAYFVDLANTKEVAPMAIEKPVMNNPAQWTVPGKQYSSYPDGRNVYALNESINPKMLKPTDSTYDIFPSIKSVTKTTGVTTIPKSVAVKAGKENRLEYNYLVEKLDRNGITVAENGAKTTIEISTSINSNDPEDYEMQVVDNNINIIGNSTAGLLNGIKTLIAIIEKNGKLPMQINNAIIVDSPDLRHRGMMLDISRNYTSFDNLKKLIDILAAYKLNVFHFHFNDDESWRLEIPGLPELTEVGSRKGYTLTENDCMIQTYAGNGNPNDASTTANGYLTRNQFVELLKYANSRGVEIIPEIETPGHARAAIVSMKARYRKYIDSNPKLAMQYKLWDDRDVSKYTSAQGYHDNVLNVAEPGTYRFMEKIVDELAAMYADANIPLKTVHIGGDEVPEGSWEGSPAVKEFMNKKGMKNVHQASEYFLSKVTEMIASKNISVGGWQEVALNHPEELNAQIAPRFSGVYVWSTAGKSDVIPYTVANLGYPVVLCNVNNYYLDMIANRHQDEPGLSWGGSVDEFTSWYSQPFNMYRSARVDWRDEPINIAKAAENKVPLNNKENIIGVQAQLWTETVRNYDMVEYFTFPKIFGLVERGWNAYPAWGDEYDDLTLYNKDRMNYNLKIGEYELPRLNRLGVNFRIGQPGIIIKKGKLYANTQYPGMVVRYTTDGSEPTENSPIWKSPVSCKAKLIKAKAFYLGKESLTTFLFNE